MEESTESATLSERLLPSGEKQADALSLFVRGLLEEESVGPEQALESFRESLVLDPTNVELALRVSQDELRRGDTVAATAVLKDTLKALPKSPEPALALALIYSRHLKKPELAVKYARQALTSNPGSFTPYEVLWEIYSTHKMPSQAAGVLRKAMASKSTDPDFWLSLAELTARNLFNADGPRGSGQEQLAAIADKALASASNSPGALTRSGDFFLIAGKLDKAREAYEAAYRIKSSQPGLREKLASVYAEQGNFDKSLEILEEIVALNPLDVRAYDQLTQIHQQQGHLKKAAASARQALILNPDQPERHLLLADLLLRDGDFPAAAKALLDARTTFPGTPKLIYFHAMALSRSAQHKEALIAFEEARNVASRVQPEMLDARFHFDYGAAAEQAGKKDLAEELFRTSIRLDPANAAEAYNYLGYMWVDMGIRLDEAEGLIRRALELDPSNGAYIDSLGWLQFQRGQYEEALASLLRAAENLPEPDPVVMDHIGDAYAALGRTTEALIHWKKALGLSPDNKKIAAKVDSATNPVAKQSEHANPTR
ncbi:MAG: tetratricopeptide repeat protein [Terrimicrobiaceae bacterium]